MWALVICAAVAFLTQAVVSSNLKSASFDEQYHLTAGYTYLRTGDYRLATTHPPLLAALSAVGLLGMEGITLPLDHPSWAAGDRFQFSDVFLWESNEQSVKMVEAARRPLILLGAVLIIVMFLWARQMLGIPAAILALVLVAFEPNLVANARIVATDFGLSVLLFCSIWRTWHWLRVPSRTNLVLMGVFAGLAMAAKYTGLMVWPIASLAIFVFPLSHPDSGYAKRIRGLIVAGLVAYFVLWAVYSFDIGFVQAGGLSIPLPAAYYWEQMWSTFLGLSTDTQAKMGFLLGHPFDSAPWQYFPVAIAFKTPIALLVMAGVGIYSMFAEKRAREFSVLWLPPLCFLALGLTGILAIGYRHLLPALPFTVMLAANAINLRISSKRKLRAAHVALGLAALWLVISSLRVFPHQEAHFNEFAGRWQNWSSLLVDSNLDWGQDLPSLRAKMDEMGIDSVNLAYFGKSVPEKYGVRYRALPGYLRFMEGYEISAYNPYTPEPGWYAVSATSLRLGTLLPGTTNLYAFFRDLEPVARAGYSIYLYHVEYPPELETKRTVVSGTPVAQLSAQQLGAAPGVRLQTKWTRSTDDSGIVPFDQPPPVRSDRFVAVDVDFDGVFALEGYTLPAHEFRAGEEIGLELYWRRGDDPMPEPAPARARPISAFVHVTDVNSAAPIAQYDGWDTALRGLEPGDHIIQNVTLSLPADLQPGEYRLIAGLYSPQSNERLQVGGDAARGDFAELGVLGVQ